MAVKRILLVFGIIFLSGFQFHFTTPQEPYKIKVVVIDAGHGGKDPGAMGNHVREKDIALGIALKLGQKIKAYYPDVKVIYTRKTDVFIELHNRARIANRANADLFISIHCNSNDSPKPYGTEAWVMGLHKSKANLAVAQKENAAILLEANHEEEYGNFNPNSPESYIIFSLYQDAYRDQSIDFSTKIEKEFKNTAGRHDRGVKEAGFLVLWKTAMPSVLIETGFVSNPKEAKFLASKNGQDKLAQSIFNAFKAYKKEMEGDDYEEPGSTKKQNKDHKSGPKQQNDKKAQTADQKAPRQEQGSKPAIVFGVQFSTSTTKKPASAPGFKGIADIWSYHHSGRYKYVSGKFSDINEATERLKTVRKAGFSDAFVVAFKDGKRISPKEAMTILNKAKSKK